MKNVTKLLCILSVSGMLSISNPLLAQTSDNTMSSSASSHDDDDDTGKWGLLGLVGLLGLMGLKRNKDDHRTNISR